MREKCLVFICLFRANKINPDWIALIKSRGYESDDLKTFMRTTSIVSDILIMISGSFALASKIPNFSKVFKSSFCCCF